MWEIRTIYEIIGQIDAFLYEGNGTVSALDGYIDYMLTPCLLFAGVLMLIFVSIKVFTYFTNPSSNMDPYILVKPILILVALTFYKPLVELLLFEPSEFITKIIEEAGLIATNTETINNFDDICNNFLTNFFDTVDETEINNIFDLIQLFPLFEIIHFFIQIVALVVVGYIMMRQIIMKALYFILGVLVLPLALIPGNFEALKKWFLGFLGVLLWIPLLRIFQTILLLIHKAPTQAFGQSLFELVLQIIMIVFILQVPKYANFLVSSGSEAGEGLGSVFSSATSLYYLKNSINPITNRKQ
ncbi:hypothetical protein [uncultured Aquimarina sp.]|uniref:hypothetical protein n=1 Tax=uncultured Aquimarina sp. TaxID=575652 RepID=UPI00262EC2D1|nr:hypothetical protein [uncultured Aquimarina sp.]